MIARKNALINDVNYSVERIRLEIRKLYDLKKVKKIDVANGSGRSRAYFDDVIKGNSSIDIRVLLAINELLEEKINWFDLESLETKEYTTPTKEDSIMNEPNIEEMKDSDKEMLKALQMITSRLEGVESVVKDLKQTGTD